MSENTPKITIRFLNNDKPVNDPNLDIARQINEQIDIMIRYKPYSHVVGSLRIKLSHAKGAYRKYADELLANSNIYSDNTNVGTLNIFKVPSLSHRQELIYSALERMEFNINDLENKISNLPPLQRSVVKFDTSVLKDIPEVAAYINKLLIDFNSSLSGIVSSNNNNNYIALSIMWIKTYLDYHLQYLTAFNKAKLIFQKATQNGNFPKVYTYKNTILSYEDIRNIPNLENRLITYFKNNNDMSYHYFQTTLDRIRNERNEFGYMFSLDGYNYDYNGDNAPEE